MESELTAVENTVQKLIGMSPQQRRDQTSKKQLTIMHNKILRLALCLKSPSSDSLALRVGQAYSDIFDMAKVLFPEIVVEDGLLLRFCTKLTGHCTEVKTFAKILEGACCTPHQGTRGLSERVRQQISKDAATLVKYLALQTVDLKSDKVESKDRRTIFQRTCQLLGQESLQTSFQSLYTTISAACMAHFHRSDFPPETKASGAVDVLTVEGDRMKPTKKMIQSGRNACLCNALHIICAIFPTQNLVRILTNDLIFGPR